MKKSTGLLLALLPLMAFAATRDDYARQWPLELASADSGMQKVAIPEDVYRQVQRADLGDIEVVDGNGQPVPAALFTAEQPLDPALPLRELRWFPLPPAAASSTADIALIAERDADGTVRRVTTEVGQRNIASARRSGGWLVDASDVERPIRALELEWPSNGAAIEQTLRVQGSDDLRRWQTLEAAAPLLDLRRGDEHLRHGRIEFASRFRYLRLLPLALGAVPAITAVRAELVPPEGVPDWQWQALSGRRSVEQGREYFEFELDGRFPIERADVILPGNSTAEWTLQSRDATDGLWQQQAGPWVAYQVSTGEHAERSMPEPLRSVLRDRYWRLYARAPVGVSKAPVLRLGYRPEVLVFMTEGEPPYALLAGSARAVRAPSPVGQTMTALRRQHGPDWQPASATVGPGEELAGAAALQPADPPRDWKAWLLWALLIGGAALVAGLAFSLLKKPAERP